MKARNRFLSALFVSVFAISQVAMFSVFSNEYKTNCANAVVETERNEAVRSSAERYLTLSNPDEVTGAYGYSAICNLNYLGDLASISITVYFDATVVRQVNGASNYAACYTYDLTYDSNSVTYTALFTDSKESGTALFYFSFGMRADAPACQSYFDVVVNEAYDSSLNEIEVAGIRKYYKVNAYDPNASYGSITFRGYAPSSTKMNEEFDILYTASSANIASGSLNIYYDNEFFEPVSFTPREFLNNKIVDYNLNIPGTVYVSFVSTEYSSSTTLFVLRFRTIKNQNAYKQFQLATNDLYDLYLNALTFKSNDAYISVQYDASLDENRPTMMIESALENNQITVTAKLTADSHLGAGDFVLAWDKDYVEYVSYQKLFTPSFFNVNTKEIDNKKVKFSIISLTDIIDANNVLSVTFNTSWHHDDEDINFTITGSGLTDSLTNPISLNFVNCSQVSLGSHNFGDWETVTPATYTEEGLEKHTCTVCDYEETRAIPVLEDDPNHYLETSISAATLYGQESDNGGVTTVNNIAIRFGGRITKAAWDEIEDTWPVTDYGVMLVKKTTLENTYGMTSVEQAYHAGKTLAIRSKVSSGDPYELPFLDEETNNYYFTLKVNITGNDYSIVYCAAPFIVAGGQYYFLDEMRYSVKSLAQYYLNDDNYPYLTNAGLQYLINY